MMNNYKNGSGNVPRLPDRVVDTLIDSAGVSRCAPGRGNTVIDQTAAVENLVHAVCEELLARLPAITALRDRAPAGFVEPDHLVKLGQGIKVGNYIKMYATPFPDSGRATVPLYTDLERRED